MPGVYDPPGGSHHLQGGYGDWCRGLPQPEERHQEEVWPGCALTSAGGMENSGMKQDEIYRDQGPL